MDKRSAFTYACWKGNTFKGSFSQNNDNMQMLSFMGFSQLREAIAQSAITDSAFQNTYLLSLAITEA